MTEEKKRANMNFQYIAEISEYRLRQVWNANFSDNPFPKVKAFILKNGEFFRVYQKQLEVPWSTDMRESEYGEKVPDKEIGGFVVGYYEQEPKDTKMSYCILMRELSKTDMDYILKHELKHIYSGDVKEW